MQIELVVLNPPPDLRKGARCSSAPRLHLRQARATRVEGRPREMDKTAFLYLPPWLLSDGVEALLGIVLHRGDGLALAVRIPSVA